MVQDAEGNDEVQALGALIGSSDRIVVLTGAGISTESGIPDFRSPGGLWTSGIRPITYQDFVASEEARLEDWRRRFRMNETFAAAQPNAGHRALVGILREGRLDTLITQNIDRLHQRAGMPEDRLVEIHGHSGEGRCLECQSVMTLEAVRDFIDRRGASPRCECGGLVKAAIVSFGETIPEAKLRRAADAAGRADLFLVIGSSLQVQPAARLPLIAKRSGAKLAIVNREETPLDAFAEVRVRKGIGEVFSSLYPQLVSEAFSSR